jgi:cytochrome b6-f complex iron-sulfur subunit
MNKETIIKPSKTMDRKDFMKYVGMSVGGILLMNFMQACTEAEIPDPTAPSNSNKVDFTLDLNTTGNSSLNDGGGAVVNASNKVIVARSLDKATFFAVQSNCTHQGTTVQWQGKNNQFFCPNHSSRFQTNGAVVVGPATSALKKYNTSFDASANTIRIFE